jgi:mannobiose 2-epimerase
MANLLDAFAPNLGPWLTRLAALVGAALLPCLPIQARAADRGDTAQVFKSQLAGKIMPYWFDTALDRKNGGYVLSDEGPGKPAPAREKQLVTQARMIWGFSHAHRKGLSTPQRNYLQAAEHGYRFLLSHFLDRQHGGYYWTTDLQGRAINRNKIVYGQSFVIYGLVEYYRASGDTNALHQAKGLYLALQQHAHDSKHGGWIEHFEPDWTPIMKPGSGAPVEVAGLKSANTHLHLMEAFTELYETTKDSTVRKSLAEAAKLNARYFYPPNAGKSCFHRQLDWQPVTAPSSAGLSYGHNVEFAWLYLRAQKVLGQKPPWDHFTAHLDHALKYGTDHQLGGLYSRGINDQPATDTDKVWWVEAEMMAALTDALRHRPNAAYSEALDKLNSFILKYQADPSDGIWYDTVAADGTPKRRAKAHNWKANYHDVRAIVKFIEAFGGGFP